MYLVCWGEVECCCDGVDVVDVEVFEGEGVVVVGVVADVGLPGVVELAESNVVVVDGVGGVEALEFLVDECAGCGGVLSGSEFLGDVVGGGCVVGGDDVDEECGASGERIGFGVWCGCEVDGEVVVSGGVVGVGGGEVGVFEAGEGVVSVGGDELGEGGHCVSFGVDCFVFSLPYGFI